LPFSVSEYLWRVIDSRRDGNKFWYLSYRFSADDLVL
jgi:hypothetical protein